jgi:PEP-CTERM motif
MMHRPTSGNALRAATATLALLGATAAHSVALNKGFVAEPYLDTGLGGTTVASRPELGGLVLEDVLQTFSFNSVSGTVQNRVVREDSLGTLDFYWRIVVDPSTTGAPSSIETLRLGNFGYGYINDADWRIDGLGNTAPFVGRVFNPAGHPEGAINFLFTDPAVGPGPGSTFFFLHTDATNYAKTATYDLLCAPSDCISSSYATFAPAPAVPEPQTYALMLAGLGLLGWIARRHRRRD